MGDRSSVKSGILANVRGTVLFGPGKKNGGVAPGLRLHLFSLVVVMVACPFPECSSSFTPRQGLGKDQAVCHGRRGGWVREGNGGRETEREGLG